MCTSTKKESIVLCVYTVPTVTIERTSRPLSIRAAIDRGIGHRARADGCRAIRIHSRAAPRSSRTADPNEEKCRAVRRARSPTGRPIAARHPATPMRRDLRLPRPPSAVSRLGLRLYRSFPSGRQNKHSRPRDWRLDSQVTYTTNANTKNKLRYTRSWYGARRSHALRTPVEPARARRNDGVRMRRWHRVPYSTSACAVLASAPFQEGPRPSQRSGICCSPSGQ